MKVSIGSSRARYKPGQTQIRLTCSGPAAGVCRGTLTLTVRLRRTVLPRVHGTRRRVTVFETIVIGRAGYLLAEGKGAVVTVGLAKGFSGTIHARATASVQGGSSATRNLTLVPGPQAQQAQTPPLRVALVISSIGG